LKLSIFIVVDDLLTSSLEEEEVLRLSPPKYFKPRASSKLFVTNRNEVSDRSRLEKRTFPLSMRFAVVRIVS